MIKIVALALAMAVPSIALPAKNHEWLDRPATEADLLRGFAFSRCLERAFAGTEPAHDAGRAADAYQQMGKLTGADIYEQVTRQAEAVNAAAPVGPPGKPLAVLACLEFYESTALKKIAKKAR